MSFPPLTVIVPTFNRPDSLIRAVRSLFAQTVTASGFTIVIVDNSPDASAANAVATLRNMCPVKIKLVTLHEPNAGVATARNTAMSVVKTDLVAFLDDDQSAPKEWLERLVGAYRAYPAPVTFGPVVTVLHRSTKRHHAYFRQFFARLPGHESGPITQSYGCGNALVDFAQMPGGAPWFDVAMNEIGGEDDRLFARVRKAGGVFAWAADAPVSEHPPAERVRLRYTLKRGFAYGQGPVTMALMAQPRQYLTALKWMGVGAVKMVWYGAAWVGMSLVRHPARAFALDKAVRGFAKLCWFVHLRFYGNAAIGAASPRPRAILRPSAEELTSGTQKVQS